MRSTKVRYFVHFMVTTITLAMPIIARSQTPTPSECKPSSATAYGLTFKKLLDEASSANSRLLATATSASSSAHADAVANANAVTSAQAKLDAVRATSAYSDNGCGAAAILCLDAKGRLFPAEQIAPVDAGQTFVVKVIGAPASPSASPGTALVTVTIGSRSSTSTLFPDNPSPATTAKPVTTSAAAAADPCKSQAVGAVTPSDASLLHKEETEIKAPHVADVTSPPAASDSEAWQAALNGAFKSERVCWQTALDAACEAARTDRAAADNSATTLATLQTQYQKEVNDRAVIVTQEATIDATAESISVVFRSEPHGISPPPPTTEMLYQVPVRQGRYFLEVAAGLGFVQDGDRSVDVVTAFGSGEQTLHVRRDWHIAPTLALNIFPCGRRKNSVAVFSSAPDDGRFLCDSLGLQVATSLNFSKNPLQEWYFGGALEIVTGLSFDGGLSLLKGSFLPPTDFDGQVVPRGSTFVPTSSFMLKPYFGLSISLDILQTLAKAAAAISATSAGGAK